MIILQTFTIHGFALIGILPVVFFLGFIVGRYIFFLNNGAGIVTKSFVQPTKTVRMQDFKQGEIYKAIASRLMRQKEVNVQSEDIQKTISKIHKFLPKEKQSLDQLTFTKLEGKNYKISLKS